MKKGSGTRSGLLWEVERLLNETENLPQILLMENVPQVISADNIDDFHSWCSFLESKGYKAGGGSAVAYAWYEFQKGYKGVSIIKWIN